MILMALTLGITTVMCPALADAVVPDRNGTKLGTVEKVLAQVDRDTPQIGVGIVAGFNDEPPQRSNGVYENQESK